MEATIHIEFGLKESTLAVLKAFAPVKTVEIAPATPSKPAVEAKPEVSQEEKTFNEIIPEKPAAVPTAAEVVERVKAARKREPNPVSREAIEALIKTYGVTASREIPESQRQDFLTQLSNL